MRPRLLAVAAVLALMTLAGCGDDPEAPRGDPAKERSASMTLNDRFQQMFEATTTPLIRSDYSDDQAWNQIVAEVTKETPFDADMDDEEGDGGYAPNLEVIEGPEVKGATPASLAASWDRTRGGGYALIADEQSMLEVVAGRPPTLVYVDLASSDEDAAEFGWIYGRSFRCVLTEVASIETNLSIANMDFDEFADVADANHGVFAGFDE